MRASGRMESSMELEYITPAKERLRKASGLMASVFSGKARIEE
jgi:hypothetical protein